MSNDRIYKSLEDKNTDVLFPILKLKLFMGSILKMEEPAFNIVVALVTRREGGKLANLADQIAEEHQVE